MPDSEADRSVDFDPDESVGVFIGIEEFLGPPHHDCGRPERLIAEVEFAVDDAVDLAYKFSTELALVDPQRVVLMLSGQPRKESSRQHLDALAIRGAMVSRQATKAAILATLAHHAWEHATARGLLIVSIASHGLRVQKDDYILGSDAIWAFPSETGLRTATLFDLLRCQPENEHGGICPGLSARRLVLIDACREVIDTARSRGGPDPRTAVSPQLIAAIGQAEGQATLLAAREGGWAFPDPMRGNGVFTAAILDSLQCDPCAEQDRLITISTLADEVEQRVQEWTAKERHELDRSRRGTQPIIDPPFRDMPLLSCPHLSAADDCRDLELEGLEILTAAGSYVRAELRDGQASVSHQALLGLRNLLARPVLSGGSDDPKTCPWWWEELGPEGGWEAVERSPDGSFSIPSPARDSRVSLQFRACKKDPQAVELVVW